MQLSIILPAKNEAEGLRRTLPGLRERFPDAEVIVVDDGSTDDTAAVAAAHGARHARSVDEALGGDVEAVLIASSTDTHVELLTRAAKAGKAILCEKPIDLDIAKVEACRREIAGCNVPIMIGFNRRFDPSFAEVKKAMDADEIGDIRQVIVTSRDPEIPPVGYMKVAGGLLRDMTIHDFDLARHLLGEEPVEPFSAAAKDLAPNNGAGATAADKKDDKSKPKK